MMRHKKVIKGSLTLEDQSLSRISTAHRRFIAAHALKFKD